MKKINYSAGSAGFQKGIICKVLVFKAKMSMSLHYKSLCSIGQQSA